MPRDPLQAFVGLRYRRRALYEEPGSYDLDYAGYTAELSFYRMLLREHVKDGCVYVELGAGTGRIALPFAREGARVHAVEPARAMRSLLEEKVAREPEEVRARVTVEGSRADDFHGPADVRVTLVSLPFNAVLHLVDGAELRRAFSRAHEALEPGGCFALDMTGPSWAAMGVGDVEWGRVDERVHPTSGRRVLTCDKTRYDAARRMLQSTYRFIEDGARKGLELTLEQRMWTWQEVLHALGETGFVVDRVFGDVDFSPFSEKSPRLLVAASRP